MEYTYTLLFGLVTLTALLPCLVSGRTATLRLDPATPMKCRPMNQTVVVLMESEGLNIKLTLQSNGSANINAPFFTVENGEVRSEHVLNISHEKMYIDRENKASIKVTCIDPHGAKASVKLEGTVLLDRKEWVMRPKSQDSNNIDPTTPIQYDLEEGKRPDFVADTKHVPNSTASSSSTPLPPTDKPYDDPVPSDRKRRATLTAYNVDVLAVIDYSIYSEFFTRSSKSTDALKKADALVSIKRYFAHIFNGVVLRYDDVNMTPPIVVRLTGYIVAELASNAPWTEPYKVYDTANQKFTLDADTALGKMREWKAATANLPDNDHLMLFTRYDLTTKNADGSKSSAAVGYAYTSSTCTELSVSVIEESYDRFEGTSATAAHELGHNLGAAHDGVNNICWKDERYLMWPSITAVNTYHIWEFSKCSVSYFKYYLGNLVKSQAGLACMMESPTPAEVPDVTDTLQGRDMTFDEQCEIGLGPTSVVCPGLTSLETLCGLLYCTIPSYAGYCQAIYPALGSHCGANRWCRGGQCVLADDPSVPSEKCPFNETATNLAFTGMDCTEYMKTYGAAQCYSSSIIKECCKTCEEYETGIAGCEYGNRLAPCEVEYCDPVLNETLSDGTPYVEVCCGTCNYTTADHTTTTEATTEATTAGGHITITFAYSGARAWSLSGGMKRVLFFSLILHYILGSCFH